MALNFFLRMLLGHLIGDFPLQPYKIAVAKRAGWRGLLLHVSIVAVTTAIAIYNTTPYWYVWALVLFGVHLFIDQFRTFVFTDNANGKGLYLFILDQIAHLVSLMVISWLAVGWRFDSLTPIYTQSLSAQDTILLFVCLVIIAVWAIPILEVELATAVMAKKTPASKELVPIRRSDRILGALERLIVLGLIILSQGFLIPLVFLPRLYWLLHEDSSPNKIATYSKIGTSFVTALMLSIPIWMIPALSH